MNNVQGGQVRFLQRFEAAFGRRQAMLLKLAGLQFAEVSADGASVIDSSGRRWLDLGSFGVHLLGHRHPEVVSAVEGQLGRMGLSTKILGNDELLGCTQMLLAACGGRLNSAAFANGGSEAIEIAIRMANVATGRSTFAALTGAYHGKTLGAAALTDTVHRPPIAATALDVLRLPWDDIERAIAMIRARPPAAVFVEPIQGEGGVRLLSLDYLRALRAACREIGALFVIDEIQTGLGRTGLILESHRYDLDPDIVVLGKILSGGLIPIAATLYNRVVVGERASDPILHSSTFAGGALAAAAATATVGIVSAPGFHERVQTLGAYAAGVLDERARSRPGVIDIRGRGLMLGVEFASPALCGRALIEAARRGVLVTFCLNAPTVIRIYPPATIDEEDLVAAMSSLVEAIEVASAGGLARQSA